jgi:hypothetical protein
VGFAALHAITQSIITGRAWLGGVGMFLSFLIVAWFSWRLRPQ